MSDTRERILTAAYRAFVNDGVTGISMRTIAAAVDLTGAALYKHFDNKDALLEAIAERGFAIFEQRLATLDMDANPVSAIAQFLNAYVQFALDEPHLFEIMFVTPRARLRRFPDDFKAGRSPTFTLMRGKVDDGMRATILRLDDSLEVTRDLWAFAHGYVALFRAGRFGADRRSLEAAFAAALPRLLTGLLADPRSFFSPTNDIAPTGDRR